MILGPDDDSAREVTIVCLCVEQNLRETLAGHIVLTIGCDTKTDQALGLTEEDIRQLHELHLRKIDLADEVFFLNVGGYMGEHTQRELDYAAAQGKPIRFLEPVHAAVLGI